MKHLVKATPWSTEQILCLAHHAPNAKPGDWNAIAHACGHSAGSCRTTWVNLRQHLADGKPIEAFGNGSYKNPKRIWTDEDGARLLQLRSIEKKSFRECDTAFGRTKGASSAKFQQLYGSVPKLERLDPGAPIPLKAIHAPKHQPQHTTLTAAFFGDPLPGRSVLDRIQAGILEPPVYMGRAQRYPARITLATEPVR